MTWLDRVLALSFALLLALQFVLATHHNHELAADGADCPSCVFAHHLPSGLPEVDPAPVPVTMAHSYHVERVIVHQAPAQASAIIPKSQGPPRA